MRAALHDDHDSRARTSYYILSVGLKERRCLAHSLRRHQGRLCRRCLLRCQRAESSNSKCDSAGCRLLVKNSAVRRRGALESIDSLAVEIIVKLLPVVRNTCRHRPRTIAAVRVNVGSIGKRIVILIEAFRRSRHTAVGIEKRYIGNISRVEIERSDSLRLAQSLANSGLNNLAYSGFVLKFYLIFLRMDIHIDCRRVDHNIYKIRRLRIDRNQLLVATHHRLMKEGMSHIAAVDKEKLLCATLLRISGHPYETIDFHKRCLCSHRSQRGSDTLAEQCADSLFERAVAELMQRNVVVYKREIDIGVYKCQPLELSHDMAKLDAVFFQKLASRRHMEEKILHHKVGAWHARCRLLTLELRL